MCNQPPKNVIHRALEREKAFNFRFNKNRSELTHPEEPCIAKKVYTVEIDYKWERFSEKDSLRHR
jgi:hypothetical protein